MYTIQDLLENKIAVRICGKAQAELLYSIAPFHQMEHIRRRKIPLAGWPRICVCYDAKTKNDKGEYHTGYNADDGFYEEEGYKVIRLDEVAGVNPTKITIKLPKI